MRAGRPLHRRDVGAWAWALGAWAIGGLWPPAFATDVSSGLVPLPGVLPLPGSLLMPVAGANPALLTDSFTQARGSAAHEALDIPAPRGTPVVAVADGRIAKLFNSKPGGLTVYQFDVTGRLVYYYAHLARYADGLAEGRLLRRGDPVGAVGSTGNALPDAPHLHFAVHVLGPERAWWKGTAVNPFPLIAGSPGASGPLPAAPTAGALDASIRR